MERGPNDPTQDWLWQFRATRLASLSDADIKSGLERVRAHSTEAVRILEAADRAAKGLAMTSIFSEPGFAEMSSKRDDLRRRIKLARLRRRIAEDAIAWARYLFWRRRRARLERERSEAVLAQLIKLHDATDRMLNVRAAEAEARHKAARVAAQAALERASKRATQAPQAVTFLAAEHKTRRVAALARAIARLAAAALDELPALLAEAISLRNDTRADLVAKCPGADELLKRLREAVWIIQAEIDGRGSGGDASLGDEGDGGWDGGGSDGQGSGGDVPPRPARPRG